MSAAPGSPLVELIRNRRGELGLPYAELARKGGLKLSTVHKLATTELSAMPKPATLAGLAAGLGVPVVVVFRAAARSCGYGEMILDHADEVSDLVIMLAALDLQQREIVRSIVDGLLRTSARSR
jgi:transcriptional regulator with XRE-family HTH domain